MNKKITLEDINHRTFMQKSRLGHFTRIVMDSSEEKRLEEQECRCCFYDSKIGGAAMTETNCSNCEKILYFESTNTDKLCEDCAKKHKLCKHCGADMEYKEREEF
jgi:hypothetical protein